MISFVKFLFQLYIASGEKKWLPFMSWVEILNRLNYLRIGGFETALGIQLCNMKPDFKILSFQSPLCSSVDWLEYLPITMLVRRGGGRSLVAQHWAIISSHALSIDLLHTGAHLCLILFLELLKSLWVFPLSWLQCNLNSSLFTFCVKLEIKPECTRPAFYPWTYILCTYWFLISEMIFLGIMVYGCQPIALKAGAREEKIGDIVRPCLYKTKEYPAVMF